LEAAQEVQEILLLVLVEVVEVIDDRVRFRWSVSQVPEAPVSLDRLEKITGPSIVEEEDALPQAPQRRRPELIASGLSLKDVVGQSGSHVVEQEVREEIDRLVGQRLHGGVAGRQRRRVTERTPDIHEHVLTAVDRAHAARCIRRRRRWREESLEEGELLDRAQA